jgi:hypothetical protein
VLSDIVEVEVHLSRVGVRELAELEIDDDQAAQTPVVEEQVHPIPGVADAKPALTPDEGEIPAELQEEGLEVQDERLLQVILRVLVLEVEELEDVWILDLLLGRDAVFGSGASALRQHRDLVAGQRCALVELRADLSIELADRPAAAKGFGLVEPPRKRFCTWRSRA